MQGESAMSNPTAAMIVIGDEILSGRTREANAHYLAGELTVRGIRLMEMRVVADDQPAIVTAVNALRGAWDHVFTSGGIGPTHDDITADAIAAAFGVAITHRADAMALLTAHYERAGLPFNEARQRMARIPDGATLIDNPVSTAPGFTLGNVHVMAGVPNIFHAMVASVLPTLTGGEPLLSQSLRVNRGEGEIAGPFGALAAAFPDLAMGSYPFTLNGAHGTNLVVRGTDAARLDEAMLRLMALFG
jgi:molybdenum cofactor synthesis domain-containing protein